MFLFFNRNRIVLVLAEGEANRRGQSIMGILGMNVVLQESIEPVSQIMQRSLSKKISLLLVIVAVIILVQPYKVQFSGTMMSSSRLMASLRAPIFKSVTGRETVKKSSIKGKKTNGNTTRPTTPRPATIQPCISCTSNYSTAEVVNARGTYKVNDVIQIRIIARDGQGVPKRSGGDYFRVKLYTKETESSSSIDVTNDLGNGTYSAEVTLRWPGKVRVIATLVHSREAVDILKRIRNIEPGRTVFSGRYSKKVNSTEVNEDVTCLLKVIANKSLCNYTDERTGYPWFCVAPSKKQLTCKDWFSYQIHQSLSSKYTLGALKKGEYDVFKTHKLPITILTPELNVADKNDGWQLAQETYQKSLPSCLPGQHLYNKVPSGFYHHNIWYSDQCHIRRFSKKSALECLRNKDIHIYGDSTARQLYEYLSLHYRPDLVGSEPEFASQARSGPLTAKDGKRNISVHFKAHGFPLRPTIMTRRDTASYIVNELDDLKVNARSVILLSLSQHFTTFPLSLYEQRIRDIKDAVRRLHVRSPRTMVIIKSANTREHSQVIHQLQNSEWYIRSLDLSLRALFSDYPSVAFIDAWDMTIAQNFVSNVHPHKTVVNSMNDQLISFICPVP